MIEELNTEIARLTVENERIKKTSKQRFEKNKKLEENKKYVDGELFKIKCINEFLTKEGFPIKHNGGIPMVNHSVINAIRSLQNKATKQTKPEVDGIYSVKIDGEWHIKDVSHRLCWMFIDKDGNQKGIHFFNTEEFILLEAK